MASYEKTYPHRRLTIPALHNAAGEFFRLTGPTPLQAYKFSDGPTTIGFDKLGDVSPDVARYPHISVIITGADNNDLTIMGLANFLNVSITGKSDIVNSMAAKLDSLLNTPDCWTADPIIFIGHGRAPDWKQLRDHLRDEQRFTVEFFESEPRAGQSIRDVLAAMKAKTGCAILIYAREDELKDGTWRPRANVIHECGFFAAGLEAGRTIVVREEGVEIPTNQAGEVYIPYPTNSIATAFGTVVATIRQLVPRA
jgi:hypothetical protein